MAHRSLQRNILRNLRDQPLHALWAGASCFAPFLAFFLGSPWWVLVGVILLSLASIVWIVLREYAQFPPHDWWDAPLDWSMYVLGGAIAIVMGVLLLASKSDAYDVHSRVFDHSWAEYAAARCEMEFGIDAVPAHPFKTDRCTGVPDGPDGAWGQCCLIHDVAYWCGGPPKARESADARLAQCIGGPTGSVYQFGTRLLGVPWLPLPFRWGYGHPYF